MPAKSKDVVASTYVDSGSPLVDFFNDAGSMLKGGVPTVFNPAWSADKKKAMQLLLWLRDVRGGAGNRSGFRDCLRALAVEAPEWVEANLDVVPMVGRWDDLMSVMDTPAADKAISVWSSAIASGDPLASKWAPRATNKTKKPVFDALRKKLGMTPKDFRKLLAKNTKVVETAMCDKAFDKINYSHVPSVAMARYRKTFSKHDCARFGKWIEEVTAVQNGTAAPESKAKVNTGAIFPHDVLRALYDAAKEAGVKLSGYEMMRGGNVTIPNSFKSDFIDNMFNALPDYVSKDEQILPVIDFSGSMSCSASGSISCRNVATSLGMYCSARINKNSPFHKVVIPFSARARFVDWKNFPFSHAALKLLVENEVANTNVSAVFELILKTAVSNKIAQDAMPTTLLILSDMQFNEGVDSREDTVFEGYRKKFRAAGYTMPRVIFWNLSGARTTGKQATSRQKNVVMISGFAPASMANALNSALLTPTQVMEAAIAKYETMVTVPATVTVPKQLTKPVKTVKAKSKTATA